MTHPADQINIAVEKELSNLLRKECDLQETIECIKLELESLAGFSTKKLFKQLDRQGRGYLDVVILSHFIGEHSDERIKKKTGFKKRMIGLMRRLETSGDGKITFSEFAKFIRPVDLKPYLKRIHK